MSFESLAGDPEERALLLEAGAELAAFGSNNQSLSYFGLRWSQEENYMGTLEHVTEWGLPVFMAPNSSVLKDNSDLLSTTYTRPSSAKVPYRRLVLACDRTYLIATNQLCRTQKGSAMLGGCHRPPGWDLPDESQFVIDRSQGDQEFPANSRQKASQMESYLLWDGCRQHSPKLETASFPVLSASSKNSRFESRVDNASRCRGKYEHLARLGEVLQATPCARYLVMDTWLLVGRRLFFLDQSQNSSIFFGSFPWIIAVDFCLLGFHRARMGHQNTSGHTSCYSGNGSMYRMKCWRRFRSGKISGSTTFLAVSLRWGTELFPFKKNLSPIFRA